MLLAVVGSDAYKWLLAFHILLAVAWVGSDVAIQIFVIRAKRAGPDRLLTSRRRSSGTGRGSSSPPPWRS